MAPRDSGGVYSLPDTYVAVAGEIIKPEQHNPPLEDIRDAITASLPRNGSAGMTGHLPMGAHKITGLADGTANTDAANVGQMNAAIADATSFFVKVRASSSTNVDFVNDLEAGDTFQGLTLVAGDYVLLRGQTSPAQNGLRLVPASGSAGRVPGYDTYDSLCSIVILVEAGDFADSLYLGVSEPGGTINSDPLYFENARGTTPSIVWEFDTSTTDGDPGAGKLRFNDATVADVTEIYFDNSDRDGNNQIAFLDALDDSTSTIKGTLLIAPALNPTQKITFYVTGSVVDGTGYRKVTVQNLTGTVLPENAAWLTVQFSRTGDIGETGATGTGEPGGTGATGISQIGEPDPFKEIGIKPSLWYDFQINRTSPVGAFTRSSDASWLTDTGLLASATTDEAVFDHKPDGTSLGLRLEGARTNSIRRTDLDGVSDGTPGTAPTNWIISSSANGITRTISHVSENGFNKLRVRYAGTPSATSTMAIRPEALTQIAASSGQTWCGSVYFRLHDDGSGIGGTPAGTGLTNISNLRIYAGGRSASSLVESVTKDLVPTTAALSDQLAYQAITLADANTTAFHSHIQFGYTSGQAIDVTFEFAEWQAEQGGFPSSRIRTTSSAVTRAADKFEHDNTNSWLNTVEGAIFVEGYVDYDDPLVGTRTVLSLSDDTSNERMDVRIDPKGDHSVARFAVTDGGVSQASITSPLGNSRAFKVAVRYGVNDFAVCCNSGPVIRSDVNGTMPTVSQINLGAIASGSSAGFLTIKRVAVFRRKLTNDQLAYITRLQESPKQSVAVRIWAGALTDTSFQVACDLDGDSPGYGRLIVSTNADLSSPLFISDPVTATPVARRFGYYYPVKFNVSGLSPNTTYYYGVAVDGVMPTDIRRLKTMPVEGTPANFSFIIGSCTSLLSVADPALRSISQETGCLFFIHLGDLSYTDLLTDDIRIYRERCNRQQYRDLYWADQVNKVLPIFYLWDDHDFGPNDVHYNYSFTLPVTFRSVRESNIQNYLESVPHYDLPAAGDETPTAQNTKSISQSFRCAHVGFVGPDTRAQRVFQGLDPGDASCLGNGYQPPDSWDGLGWFLGKLSEYDATCTNINFLSPTSWNGVGTSGWEHRFPEEQKTICDYIVNTGTLNGKVDLWTGDSHFCGADDGTITDKSTSGTLNMLQILSSAIRSAPLNPGTGQGFMWDGNPATHTGEGMYCRVNVSSDGSWQAVFKGLTYDANGNANTIATYNSTDVRP